MGHAVIKNRHSLVVGTKATRATGKAERETATELIEGIPGRHRITVAADKGYDTEEFVEKLRELNVAPHVARKKHSAIDGRTTRHEGYAKSQHVRKRIEKVFGWCKMVGALRKVKQRGVERVDQILTLTMTAYNLVRMRNLGLGTAYRGKPSPKCPRRGGRGPLKVKNGAKKPLQSTIKADSWFKNLSEDGWRAEKCEIQQAPRSLLKFSADFA